MRIRHDITLISALLFTIGLLAMVPSSMSAALDLKRGSLAQPFYFVLEPIGELGIVSLAVIAIGLIITWTDYRKGVRLSWFLLLIITWGCVFPVMLVPFVLHWNGSITLAEWISGALKEPGVSRVLVKSALIFSLMLIALILPVKSLFFRRQDIGEPKS